MISPVMPTYARAPLSFERGEGCWLIDDKGDRYLDFGAGIAVNALGHAHPALVEALSDQARRLWHTSNLYRVPGQEKLAELLIEHTFADTVFFTNSGAEAMEGCLKAARKFHSHSGSPERTRFVTFEGSFHGRTMFTIAAAGQDKLVNGFGPMPECFDRVAFGDHEALKAAIGPETAAVVIEPVQGEGGIVPVPAQCLKGLRELCDDHGVLLIFDEIQCGMGRTGKLFAHEWSGIEPDLMAVAKGIGGGFPVGAFLATETAAAGMTAGTHGTTYGGNPLAMAVASKVMEIMIAPGFLEHVSRVSGALRQGLEGLVAAHPDVFEHVRGEGLMLGLKCKTANVDVVNSAREKGLLLVPAGDNVVRVLPPLIIEQAEIDEALRRLEAAATSLESGEKAA
ncbi:MAG: aspartate aminotransferase family protein [Pseudomonadota bacterium]